MSYSEAKRSSQSIILTPVFIVGVPRSGTSWVQRLLLSDPQVCGGQETHFFTVFGRVLSSYHTQQRLGRNVGLPSYWTAAQCREQILELWQRTVMPLLESHADPQVLVEKTPDHALVLPEIGELLPEAKVIHVVRDSRAVVASLLAASQGWGSGWAPRTAGAAAIMWFRYTRAALAAGRQMRPDQYLMIRYEDLLRNGVIEAARLFRFIGIEQPTDRLEQLIEDHEFSRQKEMISPIPVVRGLAAEPDGFLRKGKVDSWQQDLSLIQKLVVWRYTRKLLRQLGYGWNGRIEK